MWIDSRTSESLQTPWISNNRGVSSLLIALVGARAKGSQSVAEQGLILSLRLCQQCCLVQVAAGGSFFISPLAWTVFFCRGGGSRLGLWLSTIKYAVELAKPQRLSELEDSLQ